MTIRGIEVGDLVMVVRGCPYCIAEGALGHTFRVSEIYRSYSRSLCCGQLGRVPVAIDNDNENGYDLRILKRIDPLHEPEHTEEEAHV